MTAAIYVAAATELNSKLKAMVSGHRMSIHMSLEAATAAGKQMMMSDNKLERVVVFQSVVELHRQASPVIEVPVTDASVITPPSNGAGDPFVDTATKNQTLSGSPSPISEWKELTVFKGLTEDECNKAFPDDFRELGLSTHECNALYKQGCIYFWQIAELSISALYTLFSDAGVFGPLGNKVRDLARDKVMEQRATA